MKTAVIIPWRQGETELQTTIESVTRSAGRGTTIYPVEDTTRAGPAVTRHRGIEAAVGADVIILVDAHMKFEGHVLRDMARAVNLTGGLLCPKCYHNPECSFDGTHPSGASYYAGADIHYKGEDQNGKQALVWKWNTDPLPGPRACIGGACYVFRRDWYYRVGQPLSALPGWGGDEEALSISAWLSGDQPAVWDGRCAHRWRAASPWKLTAREIDDIRRGSREAIISAVVSDAADRVDLLTYQRGRLRTTHEVQRWAAALLKLPRTWAEWRDLVPVRAAPPALHVARAKEGCRACGWKDEVLVREFPGGGGRYRCKGCGRYSMRRN